MITKINLFSLLLFLTSISNVVFSQERKQKLQVEAGPVFHFNNLNEDKYSFLKAGESIGTEKLIGINMKFTIPSSLEYLDYIAGTIYEKDATTYSGGWSQGNGSHYKLNGGGVYAGISPKLKGKHFGLTSELAVGIFTYKEYISVVRDRSNPPVDFHERNSSAGLGALASVGAYARFGRFGINPNFNMVFSGGGNSSFIFYGLTLPLTISFY